MIGLNAASYVEREKTPDTEANPNRSTYNAGATGTRALYELLAETGRKPVRWQESTSALTANNKNNPSTFVVVGQTRREFTDKEIEQLLRWVSLGGRLVVIDREPRADLISTTADWKISFAQYEPAPVELNPSDSFGIDSSNQPQMVGKTAAAKPVQPSAFTAKINAVQPSRLASNILFEYLPDDNASAKTVTVQGTSAAPPAETTANEDAPIESPAQTAPVVHLASGGKNLLVDFPFGAGQIVFLSDPYIVSNGGINLVDNAQAAVNILTARDSGVIAFDEYHQGFGADNNRFFEYFAGTPVVAIMLQAAILIGLIFFAQSRRFARPLPETEPNRLSKLEYVLAMAELQQRTKAFDLAIENIYTDFRRRAARFLGADNYAVSLEELAKLIAERIDKGAPEIEKLMHQCEEIIRGARTNKKEILEITSRLRETEEKLGLSRQRTARKR